MTHTPGPWVLGSKYSVETKEGAVIAECWSGIHGFKQDVTGEERSIAMKANARLISAAPDLLEALKDARFALYGNGAGNPKIDAAIAAAEGKEVA